MLKPVREPTSTVVWLNESSKQTFFASEKKESSWKSLDLMEKRNNSAKAEHSYLHLLQHFFCAFLLMTVILQRIHLDDNKKDLSARASNSMNPSGKGVYEAKSRELQKKVDELAERLKQTEIQKQGMESVIQRWEEDGKDAPIASPPGLQDDGKKLLFYGIFSTQQLAPERMQIRRIVEEQLRNMHDSSVRIIVRFIIGNNDVEESVRTEQHLHKDIIVLPVAENINEGKTYYYFKHVIREVRDHGPNAIIFKADHDTFMCIDALVSLVEPIPPTSMAYIGRINTRDGCGNAPWCPPPGCVSFSERCWIYMSGGMYGVSLLLARAMLAIPQQKEGIEDLTVATWIRNAGLSTLVEIFSSENGMHWCHSDDGKKLWLSPSAGTQCLVLIRQSMENRLCDK